MEKEKIIVPFEGKKIIADILPKGSQPEILLLHGAGISNRQVFNKLRELLAEKGIASCAFDFVGYGETGGFVQESSLESRTKQASAVIEACNLKKPLIIRAGSMAGYNAIKLTELFPVKNLILSAPAVYTKDAYSVNFGEEFSAIIRKPESWRASDAWDILHKFTGDLLIISAEKDTFIPKDVIQMIYDSSVNASSREIMTIPNAPHQLATFLQENPKQFELVIEKVMSVIK